MIFSLLYFLNDKQDAPRKGHWQDIVRIAPGTVTGNKKHIDVANTLQSESCRRDGGAIVLPPVGGGVSEEDAPV